MSTQEKITITLIIPAYNESSRVHLAFEAINNWQLPKELKLEKVIFINDGSTDNTLTKIQNFKSKYPTKIITYTPNQGKGFAVRTGLKNSESDYTLLSDADISTPLTEINKFLPYIIGGADVVFGTRKDKKSTVIVHQSFIRENMGKIYTKMTQLILGIYITDFTCGFKLFSKKASKIIVDHGVINHWSYDAEIAFLLSKARMLINEKSVTWSDEKGTKVNLIVDSIRSLWELIYIRLVHSGIKK